MHWLQAIFSDTVIAVQTAEKSDFSLINGNFEADSSSSPGAWIAGDAAGLGGFQSGFLDSEGGF
jgi:hypothetical protein